MDKKYKIAIAWLLTMWFSFTAASAIIVDYLSNTATATITIQSPLLLSISPSSFGTLYGGETIATNITQQNRASVGINNADLEIIATNNLNNVNCSDFSALAINGASISDKCTTANNQASITLTRNYGAATTTTEELRMTLQQSIQPAAYTLSITVRP